MDLVELDISFTVITFGYKYYKYKDDFSCGENLFMIGGYKSTLLVDLLVGENYLINSKVKKRVKYYEDYRPKKVMFVLDKK